MRRLWLLLGVLTGPASLGLSERAADRSEPSLSSLHLPRSRHTWLKPPHLNDADRERQTVRPVGVPELRSGGRVPGKPLHPVDDRSNGPTAEASPSPKPSDATIGLERRNGQWRSRRAAIGRERVGEAGGQREEEEDVTASQPYGRDAEHGPPRNARDIATHSDLVDVFTPPPPNDSLPVGAVRSEALRIPSVGGGYMLIAPDPVATVSFHEPGGVGGCTNALPPTSVNGRTTVSESAAAYGCELAVNAGFFNTTDGVCHGNLISNGRAVETDGPANVNFGILGNGSIVVGYLNNTEIAEWDPPFVQLIAGVIWLVRDGRNFVRESIDLEFGGTQEGSADLHAFANIVSARVALGHDAEGNVRVLQINGKSWARGMRLTQFADLLIDHGFVNAINLDGGGSATTVARGTPMSELSDSCPREQCTDCPPNLPRDGFRDCDEWCAQYKCERPVTSIVCMHAPLCYDCDSEAGCHERPCSTTTTTTSSTTSTERVESEALIEANNEVAHYKVGFALALVLLQFVVVINGIFFLRRSRYCRRSSSPTWRLSPQYDLNDALLVERDQEQPLITSHDFSSDEGEDDFVHIDETPF